MVLPVTFVGLGKDNQCFSFLFRHDIPEGFLYSDNIEQASKPYFEALSDPLHFLDVLMSKLLQKTLRKSPKLKWKTNNFAVKYNSNSNNRDDLITAQLLQELREELGKRNNPTITFDIIFSRMNHDGRKYVEEQKTFVWKEFNYNKSFDSYSIQYSHCCNICHKPIES
jgi:hypothetical protein